MARRVLPPGQPPPQPTGDPAQSRANDILHRRISELEARDRQSSGEMDDAVSGVSSGRWLGRRLLTGGGLYTPTPGTRLAHVRMTGGGGGGGGANSTTQDSAGAGGNSGWVLDFQAVGTEGRDVLGGAFSCGAGGAGGSAVPTDGATGGDTVLRVQGKTYTAKGGTGGGGLLNINGAPGTPALTSTAGTGILSYYVAGGYGVSAGVGELAYCGAGGGVAPFGSGGFSVNAGPAVGGVGLGFGSGGAGGVADFFAIQGAAGAAGAIIIDEYS